MKEVLKKMYAELTEEDQVKFNLLAENLNKNDGDISKLSAEELKFIQMMEQKYSDKFSNVAKTDSLNDSKTELDGLDIVQKQNEQQNHTHNVDLLETSFANFCRQLLARDLKEQFPKEEDAITFAFQNKWLPQDLKDEESATKIFQDFVQDISDANQWRKEVVGVESDKRMAVGMTWFMVIYQLYKK